MFLAVKQPIFIELIFKEITVSSGIRPTTLKCNEVIFKLYFNNTYLSNGDQKTFDF